jgi:hypothetical protein
LLYIGIFALNAIAMYLLARELVKSIPAAFIAGLIYGFWPYVVSRNGQSNWILIAWLPLALLFLRRAIVFERKRDAIIAGVFIALTGVTRWQLLIVGIIIIAIFLIYLCASGNACRSRKALGNLLLSGCTAILLMLPFAIPVLANLFAATDPEELIISDSVSGATNLLAYVIPNTNLALWGKMVAWLPETLRFTHDRIEFAGYITLILALIGGIAHWRKAWPWVVSAIVLVLLALGPNLLIGPYHISQLPMPYRLVGDLSIVEFLRLPSRFNAFLGLPLAMLGAFGMVTLLRYRRFGHRPIFLTAIVALLILAESSQMPYRTVGVSIPDWYQRLAANPEQFAILDLPMHTRDYDKTYMHYQMTHGKPIVEGHVSRIPQDAFAFIDRSPLLRSLRRENMVDPSIVDVSQQLRALSDTGIRFVILHKQMTKSEWLTNWKEWLTTRPIYEDAEISVYSTNPIQGRDFEIVRQLADEIGLIEAGFTPTVIDRAGIVHLDLAWGSSGVPDRDYTACVKVLDESGKPAQIDCHAIPDSWPTSKWGPGEVVLGDYDLRIEPSLEPGVFSLVLSLHWDDQEIGEALELGELRVTVAGEEDEVLRQTQRSDFHWDNLIRLQRYDLEQTSETIRLKPYWLAQQRIPSSYKVFVHLIDQETGVVVAQEDTIPRSWTYPTDLWEQGEVVTDTIELDITDVPLGLYRLQVGFYDPVTGDRLAAFSNGSERIPDDAAPLATVER